MRSTSSVPTPLSLPARIVGSWRRWAVRVFEIQRSQSTPASTAAFYAMGMIVFGGLGLGVVFPAEAPLLAADGYWGTVLAVAGLHVLVLMLLSTHRGWFRPEGIALLGQLGALLLYLGMLVYVDRSQGIAGSSATLVLFVLVVAAQCFQTRASVRAPWSLIVPAIALALAAALGQRGLLLYGFTALFLLPVGAFLGENGALFDALVLREAALREEHAALLLSLRERENAQLAEFLTRLSGHTHDLASPALALSLTMDSIDDARQSGPVPVDLLDRARRNVDELVAMIGDAKQELRRTELPPFESVDPRPVVEAVLGRIRQRFPSCVVDVDGTPPAGVVLRGGALTLGRLIDNLVANACAAAKHVELSWATADDSVELRVEDDGPGFAPGEVMRAGSGLASVRRIAETSSGALGFERSDRGGAKVVVRFERHGRGVP